MSALTEATSLTGLFIRSGPVVQVKSMTGDLEVHRDPDPAILYTGPLGVLVDRDSASASTASTWPSATCCCCPWRSG